MNDLNSVLIEGVIEGEIARSIEKSFCDFTVKSHRACRKDGEIKEIDSFFYITTNGGLACKMIEDLTENQKVRIVGRLQQGKGGVIILAEHIELKPPKKA